MKIALIGYGKMGKMIEQVALSKGHEISFKIDIDNIGDIDKLTPQNTDIAIEFTTPHSAYSNVTKCLKRGVNVVCGTTGWNDKLPEARKLAIDNGLALLWTSNFSIGVNLFFKLNQQLAKLMNGIEDYNPEITEIHHIHKKDAPSGTAITLAEGLLENYSDKKEWKLAPEGNNSDLLITAERTGEVPGTHIIKYDSEVDYIEITHLAKNRKGLASGAVLAAEFLKGKKGIYGMNDVLGLK